MARMMNDSRQIRREFWPTALTIQERSNIRTLAHQLAFSDKWIWLRNHITRVTFQDVSTYALRSGPDWTWLSNNCPNLRIYHVKQRNHVACVDWTHHRALHAMVADPHHKNLEAMEPKKMKHLTAALHRRLGEDYEVKVESCMWWSLMRSTPPESLSKIVEYEFRHADSELGQRHGHKVMETRFERSMLENSSDRELMRPKDSG